MGLASNIVIEDNLWIYLLPIIFFKSNSFVVLNHHYFLYALLCMEIFFGRTFWSYFLHFDTSYTSKYQKVLQFLNFKILPGINTHTSFLIPQYELLIHNFHDTHKLFQADSPSLYKTAIKITSRRESIQSNLSRRTAISNGLFDDLPTSLLKQPIISGRLLDINAVLFSASFGSSLK